MLIDDNTNYKKAFAIEIDSHSFSWGADFEKDKEKEDKDKKLKKKGKKKKGKKDSNPVDILEEDNTVKLDQSKDLLKVTHSEPLIGDD